ncbi:MAG: hypothetical protein SFX73_01335 [Kofleriaceae bacterium]|nr:hypothetical protein [Kofleriaceae bacterium]
MFRGSLLVVLLAMGCGDAAGTPDAAPDASPTAAARLAGTWAATSGAAFKNIGELRFAVFTAEGAGSLYVRSSSGIKAELPALYALLDERVLTIATTRDGGDQSEFFRYAFPDDNTLELTNIVGETQRLTRADAIGDAAPKTLTLRTYDLEEQYKPQYWSGLVGDATGLWFSFEGGYRHFVPENPAESTTRAYAGTTGQYEYISAIEGTAFWLTCGCGNNAYMSRYNEAWSQTGGFDLGDEPISTLLSISGAFWDGTHLWVGGYSYTHTDQRLLKLDVSSSASVVQTIELETPSMAGFVFKEGHLFAISYFLDEQTIVELDPVTGAVVETYALPEDLRTSQIRGLGVYGGEVYTLAVYDGGDSDLRAMELPPRVAKLSGL